MMKEQSRSEADISLATQSATRNLVLIGFMGTGKTTLARLCAAELGYAWRDSDRVIEAQACCPIAELFAREGEANFRARERAVIAELASTPALVISTGGGAVLDTQNAATLRQTGFVVLLTASPDTILRRVGNARSRPLLASAPDTRARIEELLAQRQPAYRAAAHCQVHTDTRPQRELAQQIVMLYQLAQS